MRIVLRNNMRMFECCFEYGFRVVEGFLVVVPVLVCVGVCVRVAVCEGVLVDVCVDVLV